MGSALHLRGPRRPDSFGWWSRWWPRLLVIASGLALLLLQLGWGGAGGARRSEKKGGQGTRVAANGGRGAGGGTAVADPRRTGVCYDNEALAACRHWREKLLSAKRVDVVLVANELFQQFPLTGYGGIETSVENIAWALHRMGIPFWVVTPGRSERPAYPFDVLETAVAPNGRGGMVGEFVEQGMRLMRERRDGTGATLQRVEAAHAALGSAPDPGAALDAAAASLNRTLVVWGQSDWSQNFAKVAAVEITSHHDGGGPIPNWDWHLPHVGHRFLSFDQRSKWVSNDDKVNLPRTRVVPHGLPPEAFDICEDKGYFLWVAGLDWGWIEKGLHIFTDLARKRPELKFVAYGAATRRKDIADKLRDMAKELPNLDFRGELKRGPEHARVFCEATAFFMPTHHSIGESFGMTVIESLSKGVPVIASTSGAVPEILDVAGRKGFSAYGAACDTLEEYEVALDKFLKRTPEQSKMIQAYARSKYDSHAVVNALLQFSLDVMAWRERGEDGSGKPGDAPAAPA